MEKEIRQVNIPAKTEKREDGSIKSIVGYPIVYNKDSEDMGFIERVAPGAAKKALKRSDIRGLKNHDPSLIFARQGVNLVFKEDDKGLSYIASPIDTQNYRETAKEIDAGLLTGQSFGFTILSDEWKGLDTDKPQRTITEIGEIFDVGPVTYPAYKDTNVGLRTIEAARKAAKGTIPEQTEKFITMIIGTDEKNSQYKFTGESRFKEAEEMINSLRSESKPTLPDDDISDHDPKIENESEETRDDTLNKINDAIKRYEKK